MNLNRNNFNKNNSCNNNNIMGQLGVDLLKTIAILLDYK